MTWTDTKITCILPENQDSNCSPVIEVPGNGYAGVENVPPISYRFVSLFFFEWTVSTGHHHRSK